MATAAGYSDAPLAKKLGFKGRLPRPHQPCAEKLSQTSVTASDTDSDFESNQNGYRYMALLYRFSATTTTRTVENARRNQSRRYDLGVLAEESLESRY